MGDWKAYADIEVTSETVQAIASAFRIAPEAGLRAFTQRGIGRMEGSNFVTESAWYPLTVCLEVMHEIVDRVGAAKAFQIGRRVPEHLPMPPNITDVHSALKMIDAGYHLSHRKGGRVMFDPQTGKTIDGIGHYHYRQGPTARAVTMEVDGPYPCDLQRGILLAYAKICEPAVAVGHAKEGGCRKEGAKSCTYSVAW